MDDSEQAVATGAATVQNRALTNGFRRHYAACADVVVLPIVVVELADADLFTGARRLDEFAVAEVDADMVRHAAVVDAEEHQIAAFQFAFLIGAASRR